MLGRTERESATHARLAAELGGWDRPENRDEVTDLLDLGAMTATLATVSRIGDLSAVVHLGHPAQPDPDLERSLLAGPTTLCLTSAVAVPPRWTWVGRAPQVDGRVVVDEAGMRDCRHALRAMGASPHLVPARTPLADRLAIAGEHGSIVLERELVPPGYHELPGSARLRERAPLWYGRVQSLDSPPAFDAAQVWFAFGPRDEFRGSLQESLGVIAAAGIDLQHLRSQQADGGPHVFFAAFRCEAVVLERLLHDFDERGVARRVLAVLPADDAGLGPTAVTPRWSLP